MRGLSSKLFLRWAALIKLRDAELTVRNRSLEFFGLFCSLELEETFWAVKIGIANLPVKIVSLLFNCLKSLLAVNFGELKL